MAKTLVSSTFASMFVSAREDVKRAQIKSNAIKGAKPQLQEICKMAAKIAKSCDAATTGQERVDADVWTNVNTYAETPEVTAQVYISLNRATSLDSMAWKKAVFAAKIAGFVFKGDAADKQASKWSAGMDWKATRDVAGVKAELTLRLELADEGATCVKVQVGTKLEETPIYELRCS